MIGMIRKYFFILSAFYFLCGRAEGGLSLEWKKLTLRSENQIQYGFPGGGGGTEIQALAWSDKNPLKVLVGTGYNGVWFSEDSGATFKPSKGMTLPDIKDICFSPWKEKTVYCLAAAGDMASFNAKRKEGLWRSMDWGQTWEFLVPLPLEEGVWGRMIAFFINSGKRIVVVGSHGKGILISKDGGDSWLWHPVGLEGWIAGVLSVKDILLIATTEGVFRSTDGAESFKSVKQLEKARFLSPRGSVISRGAGDPPPLFFAWPEEGIYVSRDMGITWKPFMDKPSFSTGFPASIYSSHIKGFPFLAMLRRPDKHFPLNPVISSGIGRKWKQPDKLSMKDRFTGPSRLSCEAVAFHPETAGIILSGIDRELMRSTDGGFSWQAWGSGLFGWKCAGGHFAARDTVSTASFWLALGDSGLWHTDDGGKSFRKILKADGRCVAVVSHPNPEKKLLLTWWRNRGKLTLKKSTDNGITWQTVLKSVNGEPFFLFHPFEADTVFAGCWKSEDCGKTFREMEAEPFAVFERTGKVLYGLSVRDPWKIMCSTTSGRKWEEFSFESSHLPGNPLCAVTHPDYSERLFVGTTQGLLFNLGKSWKSCRIEGLSHSVVITSLIVDSGNRDIIIASDREPWIRTGGIIYSTDRGDSWNYSKTDFPVLGLVQIGSHSFLAASDIGIFKVKISSPGS